MPAGWLWPFAFHCSDRSLHLLECGRYAQPRWSVRRHSVAQAPHRPPFREPRSVVAARCDSECRPAVAARFICCKAARAVLADNSGALRKAFQPRGGCLPVLPPVRSALPRPRSAPDPQPRRSTSSPLILSDQSPTCSLEQLHPGFEIRQINGSRTLVLHVPIRTPHEHFHLACRDARFALRKRPVG